MFCYSSYKMQDYSFFNRAMFGFVIFSVAAGVYGMIHGNTLVVQQNGIEMMRFCGTSSDPNIMGYKFILGLTALLFTDMINNKVIKVVLATFLLIMIFRTGSTTAIIGIGMVIALWVILQRKSFKNSIILIISATLFVIFLLNVENILMFLASREVIFIEWERLLNQYYDLIGGDISSATSLRTDVWAGYMNYYWNEQNIFYQLFGGNISNIYGIEKDFAKMSWVAAAHNTFIDILMSVGVVGLIILLGVFVIGLKNDFVKYVRTRDSLSAMKIAIKIITLFYMFALSLFLSYGFMIFLI
ncbi:MAG: O-antigen ligase family protein [Clostridia bacterium]|nr:O-antigen ligase family protein [Clostridia bacterium]